MPEEIGEPTGLEGQAPETPSEVTPPVESEVEQTPEAEGQGEQDDLSNWTLEDAVKKVKEIRAEAAKYRTRAQKFESAFADLDDDSVQGFLGLVTALRNGDQAAVPVLQAILEDLSPAEQEQLQEALEETPTFKTQEELDAYLEKRDAEKEEARKAEEAAKENFNKMKSEIEDLGYSLDEATPDPATSLLFFFAGQQPKDKAPDFKAAHEKVEEFRESIIKGYVESVNETRSRYARITTAGATPEGPGGNKSLKLKDGSAAKAMEEFLANAE